MQKENIIPDKLIMLNCEDDLLYDRVVKRRMDPFDNNKIYNLVFNPPPTKEIEDRLIQRKDDTKEALDKRLEQYHENINLIKDFYGDSIQIVDIDASGDMEEIYVEVSHALVHKDKEY